MPTDQILALLIAERDKLDRAIEALRGSSKNPPVAMDPKKKRKRQTAAQRKAKSERMKAYWVVH